MSVFKKIERELHAAIGKLQAAGKLPSDLAMDKVEAAPPRDAAHGDIATNAALVIAPQTGQKPQDVAGVLLEPITAIKGVAGAEIAGPGFINMTLKPEVWQQAVADILKEGIGYGNADIGKGRRVNIEYVSANPTGPMHVGHGRGAVYGDVLATLLIKAGYNVTKEYYINDAGAQVDKLAESAYLRYRQACGEDIGEIPEGLYPGDYLVPVGEALCAEHGKSLLGKPREEWLALVREFAVDAMMALIKDDLFTLGVRHDVFTSEQNISKAGKVKEAISQLEKQGLIYTGVLEPPKGKTPDDWEPREQTLFKSTEFGDDCDRPIKKSDGSWTYFAPDIAYHYDKCQRGADLLVDVLGADHGGYVKRIKAVVQALTGGKASLEVKLCQLVKLTRGGEPVKMSKRAGTFVTLREVIDEVGKGVFRFIMLTRKNDMTLDFDFEKVVEQSKDNPVFYVQYAHARAKSVLRTAVAEAPEALKRSENSAPDVLKRLVHPQEMALIRQLCGWPRTVEQAASALEPHRIAFYLQDVAAGFHGFWNLGNDEAGLRFLVKEDGELSAARLALARAVAIVIASGLMVLGVEPMEEMR